MTAIFVTHDQTEANALADRVAVMEGGVLQQFASQKDFGKTSQSLRRDVRRRTANERVRLQGHEGDRVRFAIDNGPTFDFADSDIPQSVRTAIGDARKS